MRLRSFIAISLHPAHFGAMDKRLTDMIPSAPLTADYPGGNIVIEKMMGNTVWLSPDFRGMQEGCRWFYWSFRARNRTPLCVVFSHRNYLGARGPAISRDGGRIWKWLGREGISEQPGPSGEVPVYYAFTVPAVSEDEDIRYAFCPQYQESHFQEWLGQHAGHPAVHAGVLCRSRKGRAVEQLEISDGPEDPAKGIIVLTARHHSCETMAGYALEGFLSAVLSGTGEGRALRSRSRIIAFPFMDKDGVEEGDQGKLRAPHDHNRDYQAPAVYPEVAAMMRWGRTHREKVVAFLDFHGPMVHGPWDNRFYLVGGSRGSVAAGQDAFAEAFRRRRTGAIPLYTPGVLHYGEAWNTGANYAAGTSAAAWAGETFESAAIVTAMEIPFANAEDAEVTPETARALGRDLAVAMCDYLG